MLIVSNKELGCARSWDALTRSWDVLIVSNKELGCAHKEPGCAHSKQQGAGMCSQGAGMCSSKQHIKRYILSRVLSIGGSTFYVSISVILVLGVGFRAIENQCC